MANYSRAFQFGKKLAITPTFGKHIPQNLHKKIAKIKCAPIYRLVKARPRYQIGLIISRYWKNKNKNLKFYDDNQLDTRMIFFLFDYFQSGEIQWKKIVLKYEQNWRLNSIMDWTFSFFLLQNFHCKAPYVLIWTWNDSKPTVLPFAGVC